MLLTNRNNIAMTDRLQDANKVEAVGAIAYPLTFNCAAAAEARLRAWGAALPSERFAATIGTIDAVSARTVQEKMASNPATQQPGGSFRCGVCC